jgi:hypothetical protein
MTAASDEDEIRHMSLDVRDDLVGWTAAEQALLDAQPQRAELLRRLVEILEGGFQELRIGLSPWGHADRWPGPAEDVRLVIDSGHDSD